MNTIYDNNKPISKLNVENAIYEVGGLFNSVRVLEINPYLENGEMASITWFCVNLKNKTELRINPRFVISVEFNNS